MTITTDNNPSKDVFGNAVQTAFPQILIFLLKINFFMFSDYFDVLMSKIIFKK
jgi:hypothetical protein